MLLKQDSDIGVSLGFFQCFPEQLFCITHVELSYIVFQNLLLTESRKKSFLENSQEKVLRKSSF